MISPLLAGLGLGFSLIIAIGAQNLFVLRQGLRRELVVLVAAICAASDAALIALGVSGVGLVLHAVPWLIDVVRWAGAVFLVGYGLLAARRAWRPSGHTLEAEGSGAASGASDKVTASEGGTGADGGATAIRVGAKALPVVATCLALTWLNPHVYLDTVFLLGTVANTHGDARWIFAAGAMAASVIWFFALAFGARYLGRWLSTPRAWRILDAVIAVVMIVMGVGLVLPR
ncbi:L-lysine exporter family protein LysE/ArgO [Microbacterium sp. cf046]|uniref:LysE/ArgO family amino acid transporter n=1 Tax=Microbacterium sp. cf046 TaxID=1761803 RepID=UPI0008F3EE16|nr:LysE/ArgO family amino acid transporter [Microbacterium sp. cf046]SFS15927.1 L-lysine exporter family protein LysE/ArgO [Microbacterium sp. cf046]